MKIVGTYFNSGCIILLLAGALNACSGGGGSQTVSSGTSSGGTASGTVTGFGSIIVDGQEYSENANTTYKTLAMGAASGVAANGIQLGQHVILNLDAGKNISLVGIAPDVIGTVTSITAGLATGSGSSAAKLPAIVVAGVTVTANTDSAQGPVTTFGGGYTALTNVLSGDNIEVHGLLLSVNGIDYIQATYLGKLASFAGTRVTGSVTAYNPVANTFKLGSGTNSITIITGSSTTVQPGGASLSNGEVVSVWSNSTLINNTLTADIISVRSNLSAASQTLAVSGAIGNYVSKSAFVVNGVTVDASGVTLPSDIPALANGLIVAVNGTVNRTGTLIATQLNVFKSQVNVAPPVSLQGTISNFVSTASFSVRGVIVDASQNPVFNAGYSAANLQNGTLVQISGTLSNNVVIATGISFVNVPNTPVVVDLTATVQSYNSATGELTLTVIPPGANASETIPVTLGSQITFANGTLASLTAGKNIEIHALYNASANSFILTAVTFLSAPPQADLATMATLGQLLFNDAALSASGKQSCATCHSPGNAFSAGNNAPVQFGGSALTLQGLRNSPTVMYASYTPDFTLVAPPQANTLPATNANQLHPAGGIMLDGRQPNLAAQAQQPFITPFEMGNSGSSQVVASLLSRPYLSQFTAVFGPSILNNSDATVAAIGVAIAAFESATPGFHPFTSKYDAYMNGQATLTAQESAGLQAFFDPNKGHCTTCHTTTASSGTPAKFTDYSYHVLGVPRNWKISYNLDSTPLPSFVPANGANLGAPGHNYYDMGLCGPFRTDLASNTSLCGSFKVPTLRNAGVKQTYFHNGVFSTLNEVVSFYATRNSNPARWYTKPDGTPDILYNDLPVAYAQNVEPTNNPGKPIAPGLNATDIQNVVSFLCTLTDGYDPKNPSAYNTSGQCAGL